MQRSKKQILEEIDEAETERSRCHIKAKGLYESAKKANRDMTLAEQQEFNTAADHGKAWKAQLTELRNELTQVQEREERIRMHNHPSGTVYNQTRNGAPDRVLDNNGQGSGTAQRNYARPAQIARLKSFPDAQTAYDSGMWYLSVVNRACLGRVDDRAEDHCRNVGLEISNAAYEGSGPAGGYTLPVPISSAIIEVRERVGVARQVCNVMPTPGDTLTIPKKAGGLTVYVVPENTAITASDKSWSQVACALQSRKVLSLLSAELSEDSIINMIDNIVSEQAYALALQEDDDLCNGTGASTYGNIVGLLSSIGSAGVSTAAANHNLWSEIDIADMAAFVGKLPDRYFAYNPGFVCSHSFFNQVFVRLAYTAGGVTANEVMGGTANRRSFWGYPVYLTSKMPTANADSTKCCLFGAFDQAVILADRGGLRVQRSDDVKFIEDQIALKTVSRYDMNVHDKGDSSNAGAYVALSTNAA